MSGADQGMCEAAGFRHDGIQPILLPGSRRWACVQPLCVGLLALLLAGGCAEGEPTYPVRGKVTSDGQPVSGGAINFFPAQGKPLGGPIRRDGTYAFELPAGEYRVAINAPPSVPAGWKEGDPVPLAQSRVPPRYARPDTSGLTLTVSADDSPVTRDFELP